MRLPRSPNALTSIDIMIFSSRAAECPKCSSSTEGKNFLLISQSGNQVIPLKSNQIDQARRSPDLLPKKHYKLINVIFEYSFPRGVFKNEPGAWLAGSALQNLLPRGKKLPCAWWAIFRRLHHAEGFRRRLVCSRSCLESYSPGLNLP